MQDTIFGGLGQDNPSIALFEQSIRTRVEAFALNAHALIEQNPDPEMLTNHIELTRMELSFLLNELRLLERLKRTGI